MKSIKEGCKNKLKINKENYLIKKRYKGENMEEIDTGICKRKINKS